MVHSASQNTHREAVLPVVGEPLAWMRRWAFDGEKPAKVRNDKNRLVWPNKFKWLPVTVVKIFPDDVPLFPPADAARTTSQPGMEARDSGPE